MAWGNVTVVQPDGAPVLRQYDEAYVEALEELAEIVGMNCLQVPLEVAEALHAIPGIEAHHPHKLDRTLDTRR